MREIVREYECIVVVANGVYVVCTMCCAVGLPLDCYDSLPLENRKIMLSVVVTA